jgi:hypothetical protein
VSTAGGTGTLVSSSVPVATGGLAA